MKKVHLLRQPFSTAFTSTIGSYTEKLRHFHKFFQLPRSDAIRYTFCGVLFPCNLLISVVYIVSFAAGSIASHKAAVLSYPLRHNTPLPCARMTYVTFDGSCEKLVRNTLSLNNQEGAAVVEYVALRKLIKPKIV